MPTPQHPVALPSSWKVVLREATEAEQEGELALSRRAVGANETVSGAFLDAGLAAWDRDGFPLGPATIRLARFPHLDDLWTLYMWAACEAGATPRDHPEWSDMRAYVGAVRRGHWPDAEPLEHSVQAVYSAVRNALLAGDSPRVERFLRQAFELLNHVARNLHEGKRPHSDDMLADAATLQEYFTDLEEDHKLFEEAHRRAPKYRARIPAEHHAGNEDRIVPLLVLSDPLATQFKLWARRSEDAPDGNGYPLLLAQDRPGRVVLTAAPESKLRVSWLAEPLSRAEAKKAEREDEPAGVWFDGRDPATGTDLFDGTMCAHPEGGTLLSIAEVVGVLRSELRLQRIRSGRPWPLIFLPAAVLLVVVAWVAGFDPFDGNTGHKGSPLAPEAVRELLASEEGPAAASFERFALLVGASAYPTEALTLECPPNDVQAMREMLVTSYGYERENIWTLVDAGPIFQDEGAMHPTRKNIVAALVEAAKRIRSKKSSFLFYYSGHGERRSGQQYEYGILALPENFRDEVSAADALDMGDLVKGLLRKHIQSNHIMVILDCCYSGWVGEVRDLRDLEPAMTEHWSEPSWSALSAGRRHQKAAEYKKRWDGHAALTKWLLAALEVDGSGRARADAEGNRDGVVTDEELARFVAPGVAKLVRAELDIQQEPAFARLDHYLPGSGKFLFIPRVGK